MDIRPTPETVQPQHDYCLLEVILVKKTPGGIELPAAEQAKHGFARLLKVGPSVLEQYPTFTARPGDAVMIQGDPADPPLCVSFTVDRDEKPLLLVRAHCIAGILRPVPIVVTVDPATLGADLTLDA